MSLPEKLTGLKNKKTFLIIAAALCLSIALGLYSFAVGRGGEAVAEEIKEVTVKKGELKIDLAADGKAELDTVGLNFQINGVIKEISVQPGDQVKAGDIIARLDAEKYQLELEAARAGYEAARAKLAKAKDDYNNKLIAAKEKMDNAMLVYQPMSEVPDIFPAQEVALKKLAADSAREAYEAAKRATSDIQMEEAAVAQALVNLKKAEKNLEDTVLRAPVNGTVLYIANKVGETVSGGGDNADKQFAVVSTGDAVTVISQVLELDIAEVTLGQAAEVEFEALPGETFSGKVGGIEALPVSDPSGIVAYEVSILLDQPDARIKNGMTGAVSLIIEQKKDVLIIPNAAVKRVDGAAVVEMYNEAGEIVTRKVKTGFTDGSNVEVIDGLQQGDKVVIRTRPAGQGGKV
ncbi:efflux RND transporter periplasmic adaptor subunit [Desulfoscipio geothermicus]|uniref:Membrane fusion protein, macrolide-specific efflux system n=1 Tax=Desulfoscipio geothermicus DSM 3669 TaxID=1121426 RepID=A0A1I6D1Q7_9FIRM|nr:efflux RND transporter periplasmic adaptor subunit [Desulfoscipio geothermicus]SFQ99436.1 membrane fusion protein, macrolide-specific efflux system [Desulfoscipio geothermicus DSM 3669]